jgi:hypothetical protein
MSQGVAKQPAARAILWRVQQEGRGSVWTPSDFLHLGARSSVYRALGDLARTGTLRRLDRGLYYYPELNARLGAISPAPELVARAIARVARSQIQLAGAGAANVLGLSKQVPARSVYLTDGPSRTVRIGRQVLELRHAPPEELQGAGTPAGMAVQALRFLGVEGVDERVVRKLGTMLAAEDKWLLMRLGPSLPTWMQPVVGEIAVCEQPGS